MLQIQKKNNCYEVYADDTKYYFFSWLLFKRDHDLIGHFVLNKDHNRYVFRPLKTMCKALTSLDEKLLYKLSDELEKIHHD